MARKKRNWFTQTFGKRLGISDLLLVSVIVGYPIYLYFTGELKLLPKEILSSMWGAFVVVWIVTFLLKKAKRWKMSKKKWQIAQSISLLLVLLGVIFNIPILNNKWLLGIILILNILIELIQ